jgi:Tfp pilus assembly protein PilO
MGGLTPRLAKQCAFFSAVLIIATVLTAKHAILQPLRAKIQILGDRKAEALQKVAVLHRIVPSEERVGRYRQQLAGAREATWLIESASQMAEASTLTIKSVTPLPVVMISEQYVSVPVQVELVGTYHQLGGFAGQIESGETFVNIDQVRLRWADIKDAQTEQGRLLNIEMVLSALYRQP